MIKMKLRVKNRVSEKSFKTMNDALKFLNNKGYQYDEFNNYFWKTDMMMGWLMKAELIE